MCHNYWDLKCSNHDTLYVKASLVRRKLDLLENELLYCVLSYYQITGYRLQVCKIKILTNKCDLIPYHTEYLIPYDCRDIIICHD